jgi:hypothetical protein
MGKGYGSLGDNNNYSGSHIRLKTDLVRRHEGWFSCCASDDIELIAHANEV